MLVTLAVALGKLLSLAGVLVVASVAARARTERQRAERSAAVRAAVERVAEAAARAGLAAGALAQRCQSDRREPTPAERAAVDARHAAVRLAVRLAVATARATDVGSENFHDGSSRL